MLNEDLLSQKKRCIKFLEEYIDEITEKAHESDSILDFDKVEIGITSLQMLLGVLKSQEIKEPLDDVVFFAGMPEPDSPCYHVLVRPEDRRRMEKDPNISLCHIK